MFVVRRRLGERILIAGGIEVEVIEISRTRVKLGVLAPREVSVVRAETVPVAEENRAASEWALSQAATAPSQLVELLRNLRNNAAKETAEMTDE